MFGTKLLGFLPFSGKVANVLSHVQSAVVPDQFADLCLDHNCRLHVAKRVPMARHAI